MTEFYVYDVFSAEAFGGNQLAVIPDATALPEDDLQRIAREFNFSESTFVFPAKDAAHTAHVRIFTPTMEIPFAGHPFWALFAIFTPLQGFLNSLVYFRPIYMSKNPDSNITACLTCRCDRWTSSRFINNSNGVRGETNDPSGTQEIDPTHQDNHGNSEEEKIEETADCLEEGVNRS